MLRKFRPVCDGVESFFVQERLLQASRDTISGHAVVGTGRGERLGVAAINVELPQYEWPMVS
jgi:hypothetical protein